MKTVCSKRHDKHKFLHWCYVCGRGKVADWTFLKTTLVNKQRITLNIIYGGLLITNFQMPTEPAFTFSKLTIEILEQGVRYVQS